MELRIYYVWKVWDLITCHLIKRIPVLLQHNQEQYAVKISAITTNRNYDIFALNNLLQKVKLQLSLKNSSLTTL